MTLLNDTTGAIYATAAGIGDLDRETGASSRSADKPGDLMQLILEMAKDTCDAIDLYRLEQASHLDEVIALAWGAYQIARDF